MSDEKACFWCGARGGFAHSTWCQHYRRPPMPALPAVVCASYPAPAPREKHAFYRLALVDPSGAIVGTRPRKITLDGAGEYGAKQAAIELVRDEAHRHGLFPKEDGNGA